MTHKLPAKVVFRKRPNSLTSTYSTITALLLSGSLLTGCNQQSGYRMDPANQATTSSIANSNQEQAINQQEQELDALYTKIYEARSEYYTITDELKSLLLANSPTHGLIEVDWLVPEWLAFKAYVVSKNLNIEDALRQCSTRTGYKLSSCHLYNLVHAARLSGPDYNAYANLASQALYSGTVDTTISLHANDSKGYLASLIKNKLGIDDYSCLTLNAALFITDSISKCKESLSFGNKQMNYLRAQELYTECKRIASTLKDPSINLFSDTRYNELMNIQKSIEAYLFSTATTIEDLIEIAQYIGKENAVLYRHMFEIEIVDEAHPDVLGVLYPYMYEQLILKNILNLKKTTIINAPRQVGITAKEIIAILKFPLQKNTTLINYHPMVGVT